MRNDIDNASVLHGCTVLDRVLIGIGAILNDGVVVECDVMVGAGTLVSPGKRLEFGHVYAGNSARQLRPLKDAVRSFLTYSPLNYIKLKNQYLAQE